MASLFTRIAATIALCAVSAFAQYGGGSPGMPGSPGSATPTNTGKSYGSKTGIAIGAAAAAVAGGGIAYYVLHNRGKLSGCVERAANGQRELIADKDATPYPLVNGASVPLQEGERVELKGKKVKDDSGKTAFEVHELAKDYGPCQR